MATKAKGISADERRWRAEEDASTLKRYQEIVADSGRTKAAEAAIRKEIAAAQAVLAKKKGKK